MDRFTRGIIVGVVALIVAGLAVALIGLGREESADPATPRGVTILYIRALREGRLEAAYDLLSAGAKQQVSRERFVEQARFVQWRGGRTTVGDAVIEGARARVPVRRSTEGGLLNSGSSATEMTYLVQESGGWRISSPSEPFGLFLR
jgi:hypothetical protein